MTFTTYMNDENGAVTVDWVVLTAALVGLGLAVMGVVTNGVSALSGDINTSLMDQDVQSEFAASVGNTTEWNGMTTSDYIAAGQAVAPGNNGAVYGWAATWAQEDAPEGFNFNNPLHDPGSNNLIYTSDDGTHYSVGGEVTAIDDFSGSPTYFGA